GSVRRAYRSLGDRLPIACFPFKVFPMLSTWFGSRRHNKSRRHRPPRECFPPRLEALEARELLAANLFVTPISTPADATHMHSLTGALAAANSGDTITIEPGATPDAGAVNVNVSDLTIHGDPNVPGSVLPRYDLNLNASNITLDNLNLGTVTAAANVNHE